ncbi:alpha/beta hydrolase [Breoghania sp. L-A4]|uniref:alpha/beta fold hydrolase n=1 Tax=Breoghania sp. L-A4 TaxID=2304600 RepID=UPI000E35BA3D|nr:alpha/beta hydrolase [Breoghania sp. L-A4]AXS40227.1 alpha/beta hydrolase [Breoghania sp. L-A4]
MSTNITTQSQDGLRLFARAWGPEDSAEPPVVCLPGLTRNSRDFDRLASHLSDRAGPARRVMALDYRGRGGSGRDPDWRNYALPVEQADILALLGYAGIDHADFIGTSRGGLHIMMLAASRPGLIRKAVLNDIGPVIEAQGLKRIATTVGFKPPNASWDVAAQALRREQGAIFPKLTGPDWLEYARQIFREQDRTIFADYDPALGKTLEDLDFSSPPPPLWELFAALEGMPVMVVRGALSDILSEATVCGMEARHSRFSHLAVPDQGHAPLLWDTPTLQALAAFLAA